MRLTGLALAAALAASPLLAQNVVSAKAGLINLVEGEVFLNDARLAPKITEFPDVKQNGILRTGDGRAEVLLSPGSYLRVGEQSSIKMISTSLIDVKLEVLSGSAMLEVDEVGKDTPITVLLHDASAHIRRAGLYRFDSDPYDIRVYEGELVATVGSRVFTLKSAKSLVALNGEWVLQHFDPEIGDELARWSKRRAAAISAANVSAARTARLGDLNSGYIPVSGWYGMGLPMGYAGSGNWMYNPYFGMFTYVPFNGMGYSPWGYSYWSPVTVVNAYYPSYGGSSLSRGSATRSSAARSFSGSSYNSSLGYATSDSRSYGGSYSSGVSSVSSGSSGVSSSVSGGGVGGGGGHVGGSAGGGASSGGGRGH